MKASIFSCYFCLFYRFHHRASRHTVGNRINFTISLFRFRYLSHSITLALWLSSFLSFSLFFSFFPFLSHSFRTVSSVQLRLLVIISSGKPHISNKIRINQRWWFPSVVMCMRRWLETPRKMRKTSKNLTNCCAVWRVNDKQEDGKQMYTIANKKSTCSLLFFRNLIWFNQTQNIGIQLISCYIFGATHKTYVSTQIMCVNNDSIRQNKCDERENVDYFGASSFVIMVNVIEYHRVNKMPKTFSSFK